MNSSFPRAASLLSTLRQSQARARGFSLLEVAIALVIFVFGALAIVRIFPGALRVITVGGARQNAINLNRGAMARVQGGSSTTPSATYDVGQNFNFTWVEGYPGDGTALHPAEPRAVLGSTRRGYSLPRTANQSDIDSSALASIRAVIGEGTVVQQTADSPPRLFVLTQFPIYNDSEFRINEEENISGVTVDGMGKLDFSNARFDSGEPLSTSSSSPDRPDNSYLRNTTSATTPDLVYYVTYRYKVVVGPQTNIWGISDEPVVLPQDGSTYDDHVKQGSNVVPGAVTVRMKREVTQQQPTGAFGSASYSDSDASRGLISPLSSSARFVGDGVSSIPRSLRAGDKVTLDYQADWGRILQEGTPDAVPEATPSGSTPTLPRQITLAAPFIEDHATDAVVTTLYAKNSNNSFTLTSGGWGEGVTANGGVVQPLPADLRASRVTFDLGTNPNQTARVSYRTRDQWAQQLSVAAATYKPFVVNQIEPWRDYYLNGDTLFFHASEAGKSMMVTYSYNNGSSDITLRNRLLTVDDNTEQATNAPSGFSQSTLPSTSAFVSRLQLTTANGDNLGDVGATLTSISGVRGASVTVRTAWLDGSRYTQSFLTAMRAGTGAEAMP